MGWGAGNTGPAVVGWTAAPFELRGSASRLSACSAAREARVAYLLAVFSCSSRGTSCRRVCKLSFAQPCADTHAHTHTHTRTCRHIHTHADTQTHTHTHAYTQTQTHTHGQTQTQTQTQTRRRRHRHRRRLTEAEIETHELPLGLLGVVCPVYTHAHTHTCAQKQMQTQTHAQSRAKRPTQTQAHLDGSGDGDSDMHAQIHEAGPCAELRVHVAAQVLLPPPLLARGKARVCCGWARVLHCRALLFWALDQPLRARRL